MNQEMDLRSHEFIAENQPFRVNLMLVGTLVLVIALPLLASFLIDHYYDKVNFKIAAQKEMLAELKNEAVPVNELQQRTAVLEKQYRLNSRFENNYTPAAEMVSSIHTSTEASNLTIKTINLSKDGKIMITGTTDTINAGANFNRVLVKHPLIENAFVSNLEKVEEQGYSFLIKGSFLINTGFEECAASNENQTGNKPTSIYTGKNNFEQEGTADD